MNRVKKNYLKELVIHTIILLLYGVFFILNFKNSQINIIVFDSGLLYISVFILFIHISFNSFSIKIQSKKKISDLIKLELFSFLGKYLSSEIGKNALNFFYGNKINVNQELLLFNNILKSFFNFLIFSILILLSILSFFQQTIIFYKTVIIIAVLMILFFFKKFLKLFVQIKYERKLNEIELNKVLLYDLNIIYRDVIYLLFFTSIIAKYLYYVLLIGSLTYGLIHIKNIFISVIFGFLVSGIISKINPLPDKIIYFEISVSSFLIFISNINFLSAVYILVTVRIITSILDFGFIIYFVKENFFQKNKFIYKT